MNTNDAGRNFYNVQEQQEEEEEEELPHKVYFSMPLVNYILLQYITKQSCRKVQARGLAHK